MAAYTRWYTLNEDPLFSQPWTAGWDSTPTASTSIEALHPVKDGGTSSTSARAEAVSTNPLRVGLTRWATKGLKAQTISGTVDMCIGVLESNADAEFFTALNIYVSVGDTSAIRGTLLSNYGESSGAGGTEWPTTSTGYALASAQTLSSVAAQAGDRLVIEFGYVSRNSHTTSRTGTVRKGVMGSGITELADLTVGSTSTSTSAGFFDFSNAIELLDPPDNDEWANATVLTGPLTEGYSIRSAERDGDEPASTCLGAVQPTGRHSSVWYVWSPTATQTGVNVTATLINGLTDFNVGLHIFTGSPGSFVEVDCSVASTATVETLSFNATAGVQYTFLISTQFWEGGDLTFEFDGIGGSGGGGLPGSGNIAPQLLKFGLHHPIPNPEDYEDGFISGKLRQIDSITHSLSSMDGDHVGMSIDIDVDDQDRETRIALDTLGTRYLDGLEGVCKFISESRRVQKELPSVVARGYIKEYALGRRRKAKFTVEDQLTSEYGPLSSRRLISDRKLTQSLFAGLPPQLAGIGQRLIIGLVGDWGAVTPGTGTPAEKGLVPVYTVGARNIFGQDYIEFFVCGHACESIDIYGADASNSMRVAVNAGEYGSIVLAPGKPGWPFATNKYLDYTDSATGRTHRVTTFFVLATDIKAVSHLSNQISLACNVCGMEDVGDGTGQVVTGLFHAWQMVWDNWIAPNVGYHTGFYTGAPSFADGTAKTDSDSFAAAQTLTQQWVGGEGYTAGCVFQDVLAIEVMRQFARTAHANWGTELSGQMMVSLPDHTLNVSGLAKFRAPVDLRAGVAPRYVSGTIQNPLTYVYDFDPDTGRYRADARVIRDQTAIGYTGDIERPASIELYCTRDENTAVSSAGNRLLWRRYPLQEVQWPMGKEGLNHRLGDTVLVTSEDGPGSLGFVNAPIRIMKRSFHPKTQTCTMVGLVLDQSVLIPSISSQTTASPVPAVFSQTAGAPVPAVFST